MPMSMSHCDYLKVDAVSNSLLRMVGQSPAHAQEWLRNPPDATPAMMFGTMTHSAILEPQSFKTTYSVMPKFDGRTNDGKASKAAWLNHNPGKTALSQESFSQILGMIESVYNHPEAAKLLSNGASERSFFYRDPETGLTCKCRPDHMVHTTLIDVKTTEDASPGEFAKSIHKFGYHQQAAFYLDGVSVATGIRMDKFIIIAVEKKPPYAVALYQIDDRSLDKGEELYRRNLDAWAGCLLKNEFPAYSNEIQSISLPVWGFNE